MTHHTASPVRPTRAAALRLACLTTAGLLSSVGCTNFKTSTAANLAPEPPVTQTFVGSDAPVRDFDQSVAHYQNGDTASGSTGMRWTSRDITSIPSGGGSASGATAGGGGGTGAPGTGTGTAGTGIGGGNTAGAGGGRTLSGANTGPGATAGSPTGTNVTGGNTAGAGNTIGGTNTAGGGNVAAGGSVVAGGNTDSGAGSAVITGDAAAGGPVAGNTTGTGAGAATGGTAGGTGGGGDTGGGGGGGGGGVLGSMANAGRVAAVPVVETGVFIGNVVTAPITLIEQSGGIVSSGVQIPSTHTAMPALPPARPFTSEPTKPTDRGAPRDIRPADAQPTETSITETTESPITPVAAPRADESSTVTPVTPVTPAPTEPEVRTPAVVPPAVSPPSDATITTTPPRTLTPAAALSTTAFAIVGQVERPGRYEAGGDLTLLQALTAAGLIRNEQPNQVKVKLERTGTTAVTATLAELRSGTKPDSRLMPGDILTVTVGE